MRLFCLFVFSFFLPFSKLNAQTAQYATAGTGKMRNYISWFDWAGKTIANNSSTTFTTADGLNVTVTFSNVSGPSVDPWVMNTWSGAVLWQLYDFTDPTVKPALFSRSTLSQVSFTMNISATRGGVSTPFTLVVADAEGSDYSETTTFTTNGMAWRTIEFFRNSSQTNNPLTGCGTHTANLSYTYAGAPNTGQNPILATDANGSLVVSTTMNRSVQGGMAVAFGIFSPIDRGDLPSSYGYVQHGLSFTTNNSCNFNSPFPSIAQSTSLLLGTVAGDADGSQTLNDNAVGGDEDAVASFPLYNGSGNYSLDLKLNNTTGSSSFLTGWFDFNRDGNFSSNESVFVTIPNGATSANLTWTGLPPTLGGGKVADFGFRLRLASDLVQVQSPDGYAKDGEVEDYLVPQNIITNVNNCTNWLRLPSQPSYFRIGDLDIPGNQITVEATFNRTAPWSGNDLYQGDLVSKHEGPSDCNYLLRPGSAEITTTNGYFKTPEICQIELNKTYHVAMVYDGSSLKFYRNGYLMSQIAATGNLVQNNWQTQVGLYFNQVTQEQLIGYINEVRIWNIVRTQNDIKAYMDQPLPNPQTTAGLLAYYTFDNLVNKQGNTTWNGVLGGSATINETNPNCINILDSCKVLATNAQPSFTIPDTVCVNTPVKIINTSTGVSSYYWNFCVADVNTAPSGTNLGNIGGSFSAPVFIDYAFYNGNYYGFLINYNPGSLIRLDFGSSLLNTPTTVNLGNFGGIIPPGSGAEGIQLVFNEGKWYAIVVGGWPTTGSTPRILKIEFGTNLNNPAPVATNWGNLGNMSQPIDLHVFNEGNNWYGFTVNAENNTITRFSFTNSFSNTPTAVNLGNIGNLAYPTGIYAINDNGFWRVFIVNAGNNSRQTGTYSLSRLDFGSSLLNTPTGVNLGNPGNLLQHPRDLTIMKMCDQIVGFAVNGHLNNSNVIKINFNNNLSSTPTLSSLGIIGNSNFPHSISKLFRVENDLYGFITNVDNNTITRLKFNGCTNASIPNSNLKNPPPIIYNAPGIYNINLTVDDGLPTQGTFCKQVVVLGPPLHSPIQNIVLCKGDTVRIGTSKGLKSYLWNTNEITDSISINSPGIFWVESDNYGCSNRDSFDLVLKNKPFFSLRSDTAVCKGVPLVLSIQSAESYSYNWSPSTGLSNSSTSSPVATPASTTQYTVTATDSFNCVTKDTIAIVVKDFPNVKLGSDTALCVGDTLLLNAGNPGSAYLWQNGTKSQTFTVRDSGFYHVDVSKDGCSSSDTLHVALSPKPVFSIPDTSLCNGKSIILSVNGSGTYSYNWSPATGLSDATIPNPVASPLATTSYIISGKNSKGCTGKDTVTVTVHPKPVITISNDVTICSKSPTQLQAGGGVSYQWVPAQALSSATIPDPVASPASTTVYYVTVTDQNSCTNSDSLTVFVRTITGFNKPANAQVCKGDSVQLKGDNSFTYLWSPAASLSDSHIANPYAFPTSTTVYSVTATDLICKRDTVFNVMVTVNPKPEVSARKSNDITCAIPTTQLSASGAMSYSWFPSKGLDNPLRSNPTAAIDTTTTFTVTGKNEFSCFNTDTVTVQVNSLGQLFTHLPNAFTPNGDGKNDCFGIKKWGLVSDLEFSIFNRWGELIFSTKDAGQCWDGTYKGTPQPHDVYVYIIKANSVCGKVFLKGTFVLIR